MLLLFLSLFVSLPSNGQEKPAAAGADPEKVAEGAKLFEANCKACHAVHDVVVGPALKGITKRRQIGWIVNFVHNSQKVIASGDPYAVELYNKFGKAEMKSFPELSEDQIKNIVAYVVEEEGKGPAKKATAGEETTTTTEASNDEGGYSGIILILIIIVLVLVLVMLVVFLSVLKRYLKDKEEKLTEADQEIVNQKFDVIKVIKSKGFLSIVGIIFVALALRACWNNMLYVGVDQGYAPIQPIPFSHKLHAGQYKIDCNYCHTGVTKGKQANIPSLNICMNCHTHIKSGPRFGQDGIAKVVDAYNSNKPVKWVRVHNLPDLAYFNHAQHVQVGGIECKTCHGQIDTMEVVRQHSPLTMGWCINCHRETAVNGKDNAYYDKLMELHSKKGPLKVAEIGGLECSKCHY
ncbi:cytochrome c, mono- and diheme variant [Sporocytophaga myxococcoides]|uniref:Cytochrome c, mono-and diheme variant n=1 Tax=Sporocytophaga myxococcoides TaxID=153721 RepID=A0A098LN16_9BACT|nr:cytochrome c, mono- and diheme variant [Sporocytophaga myxococcoides]